MTPSGIGQGRLAAGGGWSGARECTRCAIEGRGIVMQKEPIVDAARVAAKRRELAARKVEITSEVAARSGELAGFDPARELLLEGADLKSAASRRRTLERAIADLSEELATVDRALDLLEAERARLELEHLHAQAPAVVDSYALALQDVAAKRSALEAAIRAALPAAERLEGFAAQCDALRTRIPNPAGRPPVLGFPIDWGAALWLFRCLEDPVVTCAPEWAREYAAFVESVRDAIGPVRA